MNKVINLNDHQTLKAKMGRIFRKMKKKISKLWDTFKEIIQEPVFWLSTWKTSAYIWTGSTIFNLSYLLITHAEVLPYILQMVTVSSFSFMIVGMFMWFLMKIKNFEKGPNGSVA